MADYAHVSLPRALWKDLTALPLQEWGYSSPTEFVKEAIRAHILNVARAKSEVARMPLQSARRRAR